MTPDRELQALQDAVRSAGRAVYRMARDGFETAHKANQDPVTTADLAADEILKGALLSEFPGTGWLSEETRDDPARLEARRVWIVDPIDGTKEFVTGIPEFSVSVALVDRGAPVLAAVFNPATDELYLAAAGRGATLNGHPLRCEPPATERPIVLASRSELKRGEWDAFAEAVEIRPCGSIAYKLALVAAGKAHATFSLGPKNEWDIAAGVLLVAETGGYAADPQGRPYVFNRPDTLVTGIVAAVAESRDQILALIDGAP